MNIIDADSFRRYLMRNRDQCDFKRRRLIKVGDMLRADLYACQRDTFSAILDSIDRHTVKVSTCWITEVGIVPEFGERVLVTIDHQWYEAYYLQKGNFFSEEIKQDGFYLFDGVSKELTYTATVDAWMGIEPYGGSLTPDQLLAKALQQNLKNL